MEHFQAGELHDLVAVRRSRARFKIGKRVTAGFVGQKWPTIGNSLQFNLLPVLLDLHWDQEQCLNKAVVPATTMASSKRESWTMAAELGGALEPLMGLMVETQRRGSLLCARDPHSTQEMICQLGSPWRHFLGVRLLCCASTQQTPHQCPDTRAYLLYHRHMTGEEGLSNCFPSLLLFLLLPRASLEEEKFFGAGQTGLHKR